MTELELFGAIILSTSDYYKFAQTTTDAERLALYSKSIHWLVRFAVAGNKNTPAAIRQTLKSDINGQVREEASRTVFKDNHKKRYKTNIDPIIKFITGGRYKSFVDYNLDCLFGTYSRCDELVQSVYRHNTDTLQIQLYECDIIEKGFDTDTLTRLLIEHDITYQVNEFESTDNRKTYYILSLYGVVIH